ncbi:MAG TPA: biopolymer transporter ExbD [Pseudomonadales bacterium]|nr:biopolymer transporter ExbD [Pseudomonadales bacterium]
MKRKRNSDDQGGQIDLTPMLDVVFIMLIFFIVTASFVKLPKADYALTGALTSEAKKPKIIVAVTETNDFVYGDKTIEPRNLKRELQKIYADAGSAAELSMRMDAKSNAESWNILFKAATDAGIPKENIYLSIDSEQAN